MRGYSQLALAHAAGVSPRHVSFIETGRSLPSRTMILRLAETLSVPLREQNALLRASGYAPMFPARAWSDAALRPMRRVVERMLQQQEPYPGFVLDRHWDIVSMNRTAEGMFQPLIGNHRPNAVDVFIGPGPIRQMLVNWDEIAWHTLIRLRREVALSPGDSELDTLLERAEQWMRGIDMPTGMNADAPVLESELRLGEETIRTVTTIASFSAARDVTLDELRVELVYPADGAAERFFLRQAGLEPSR